MLDYTIHSFTSGKKIVISAYMTDYKDNMEDMNNSHSSAYSSLTNSTNEISGPTTIIQSPIPTMSAAASSETKHKNWHIKNQTAGEAFGYSNYHRNNTGHQYQAGVTNLSNIPVLHDGYNSSASSVGEIGSASGQKVYRSSRDVTLRTPCASPPTSTSIEIRNIIDDYNATLRRATKEIKGKPL